MNTNIETKGSGGDVGVKSSPLLGKSVRIDCLASSFHGECGVVRAQFEDGDLYVEFPCGSGSYNESELIT